MKEHAEPLQTRIADAMQETVNRLCDANGHYPEFTLGITAGPEDYFQIRCLSKVHVNIDDKGRVDFYGFPVVFTRGQVGGFKVHTREKH